MTELYSLPQIISGFNEKTVNVVKDVFGSFVKDFITLSPIEAELAKLFANSFRYAKFAIANQYYMLAEASGLDFYKIYHALTHGYPRMQDFPKAGFSAGPCLVKDTRQLLTFAENQYSLGHSAIMVNEGMPQFLVNQIEKKYSIKRKIVGILGMAFKGEIDDSRDSLSYKLKKILTSKAKQVLCTDEYINDTRFFDLNIVLEKADILILGAPHKKYQDIQINKPIYDVWNFLNK